MHIRCLGTYAKKKRADYAFLALFTADKPQSAMIALVACTAPKNGICTTYCKYIRQRRYITNCEPTCLCTQPKVALVPPAQKRTSSNNSKAYSRTAMYTKWQIGICDTHHRQSQPGVMPAHLDAGANQKDLTTHRPPRLQCTTTGSCETAAVFGWPRLLRSRRP